MCPVKPALADGRLFVRTLNKLVCYDLRRPAGMEVDSVAMTLDGPLLGYPDDAARGEAQLRIVDGRLSESYVRLPRRDEVGRPSRSPWLASQVAGLAIDDEGLTGTMSVRVGHHDERWTVELKRDGQRFEGTCRRRIPPLSKPLAVKGTIDGKIEKKPDGATWWVFTLEEAASQKPTEREHPRVEMHLVVERAKDGTVHHWGRAGKMNRGTHELDASEVTIKPGAAGGRMTVIFHADPWVAPNPETGGPLAARFTIDAKIAGDAITGTYEGTLGVEHEITCAASGTYHAGKDVTQ